MISLAFFYQRRIVFQAPACVGEFHFVRREGRVQGTSSGSYSQIWCSTPPVRVFPERDVSLYYRRLFHNSPRALILKSWRHKKDRPSGNRRLAANPQTGK